MFCRFPTSSSRKAHPTEHATGTQRGNLIYHATHLSSQKAKKKEYKSVLDRFLKSLRCRMDRRTLRTPWMRSRSKITPTSLRRQSAPDVKILWSFCSAAQVRTAPWISEKMTKKPKELKNDFIKSLEKMTQDFIPVSKFDSDQVNHSPGTMKALSVSTHRQAGGGTTRTLQPALPPRGWQPSSWWQSSSWSQTSSSGER